MGDASSVSGDLSDEALSVWASGRLLATFDPAARDGAFTTLLDAAGSATGLKRLWALEALYRNLWHWNDDQRRRVAGTLVAALSAADQRCSEHAIKGLQHASEFLDASEAQRALRMLKGLPDDRPHLLRLLAAEFAYGIFLRFADVPDLAIAAGEVLQGLHALDREWVERTVTAGFSRLTSWTAEQRDGICVRPIGIVRNGFTQLHHLDNFDPRSRSTVQLRPDFTGSLSGLERFSHVSVVCYLDDAPKWSSVPAAPARGQADDTGIFATTTACRPNPIFVKTGRVREVHDTAIDLEGIKALDLTPVLDIKPYFASRAPAGPVREAQ